MKIEKVKITQVKSNPNNPRLIKDDKFDKLVRSIAEFPEMLEIRPIVVNKDMVVLGGNMRLKACIAAGLKEIPIIIANNISENQEKEFIIKDNLSGGEWDWDTINNEWGELQLEEWGLDIPVPLTDYFITEDTESKKGKPEATTSDNDYSTYELVMLHENKLILLDTLNSVKKNFLFEKQEDALMEIIRQFNNIK